MCLNNQPRNKQQGSMLITALFVIIVMSLLGLTLTRLLSASSDAVNHEIFGIRAMNAAQSALQVKISQAFPLDGSAAVCDDTINMSFITLPGLENCSAEATCTEREYSADNVTYYQFESTGTCTASDVITTRTVAVDGKVET